MPDPSLEAIQYWMKSHIQGKTSSEMTSYLNPQGGDPGEARLSVYEEGYRVRFREALEEVYEAVHRVLGKKQFQEVAHRYAKRFPSHDYNLSYSGRHFPEFLKEDPIKQVLPFLPDLAALEWKVTCAFHAQEGIPFDRKTVQEISLTSWDEARLTFRPAVSVLHSSWPILEIWEVRHEEKGKIDIALMDRPQTVLIFRQGGTVYCEAIDPSEGALLQRLLEGKPLGEALEGISEGQENVSAWVATWIQKELIQQVVFQEERGNG